MRYAKYREARLYVSDSSGHGILGRMNSVSLLRASAVSIQVEQAQRGEFILAPCNWCGKPTGDWCEGCEEKYPNSPACHANCFPCDRYWVYCRLCRLELQVEERINASTHRVPTGAWLGTMRCHCCGIQKLKLGQCTACGIGRYCSIACQRKDWATHTHYCECFQQKQPLCIVYPCFNSRAVAATSTCPGLFPPARSFF